ncbi:MAG: efflux transporter outer membrane subunit, partial [Verrucomicrobiales bacterium]
MRSLLLITPLLLLCSCSEFLAEREIPCAATPAAWKHASEIVPEVPTWNAFGDEQLLSLIDQAIEANQDLAQAEARIRQARAAACEARAGIFPQPQFLPGATLTRFSENVAFGNFGQGGRWNQQFQTPFSLSYEPDLWGRLRNTARSAFEEADAAGADFCAARLLLAANIAGTYFQWQSLKSQQQLLDDTVTSREKSYDLLKKRFEAGLEDQEASAQARLEIATARSDSALVTPQLARAANALAILCGQPPGCFCALGHCALRIPPSPRPNLPAEVICRRPDVAAALSRIRSTVADEQVAKAAYFPALQLTGTAGQESEYMVNLLDAGSFAARFVPSISIPMPDAGRRNARLERARGKYDEALASWRQTLLVALREVEDSLASADGSRTILARLDEAEKAARDYVSIVETRYQ